MTNTMAIIVGTLAMSAAGCGRTADSVMPDWVTRGAQVSVTYLFQDLSGNALKAERMVDAKAVVAMCYSQSPSRSGTPPAILSDSEFNLTPEILVSLRNKRPVSQEAIYAEIEKARECIVDKLRDKFGPKNLTDLRYIILLHYFTSKPAPPEATVVIPVQSSSLKLQIDLDLSVREKFMSNTAGNNHAAADFFFLAGNGRVVPVQDQQALHQEIYNECAPDAVKPGVWPDLYKFEFGIWDCMKNAVRKAKERGGFLGEDFLVISLER